MFIPSIAWVYLAGVWSLLLVVFLGKMTRRPRNIALVIVAGVAAVSIWNLAIQAVCGHRAAKEVTIYLDHVKVALKGTPFASDVIFVMQPRGRYTYQIMVVGALRTESGRAELIRILEKCNPPYPLNAGRLEVRHVE